MHEAPKSAKPAPWVVFEEGWTTLEEREKAAAGRSFLAWPAAGRRPVEAIYRMSWLAHCADVVGDGYECRYHVHLENPPMAPQSGENGSKSENRDYAWETSTHNAAAPESPEKAENRPKPGLG